MVCDINVLMQRFHSLSVFVFVCRRHYDVHRDVPASHHSPVRRPRVMCRHALHQAKKAEERNIGHPCRSFVFFKPEGGRGLSVGQCATMAQRYVGLSYFCFLFPESEKGVTACSQCALINIVIPKPALQTHQLFTRILPSSHTKAHLAATRNNDECGVRGNDSSHLATDVRVQLPKRTFQSSPHLLRCTSPNPPTIRAFQI